MLQRRKVRFSGRYLFVIIQWATEQNSNPGQPDCKAWALSIFPRPSEWTKKKTKVKGANNNYHSLSDQALWQCANWAHVTIRFRPGPWCNWEKKPSPSLAFGPAAETTGSAFLPPAQLGTCQEATSIRRRQRGSSKKQRPP